VPVCRGSDGRNAKNLYQSLSYLVIIREIDRLLTTLVWAELLQAATI